MPDRDDLPQGLQILARRNAVRIDHETFRSDVAALLDAVERILRTRAQRAAEQTVRTGTDVSDWAIDNEYTDQASEASNLGIQLANQGDVAGARAAYQRAIASGHAEWAPKATVALGRLLTNL